MYASEAPIEDARDRDDLRVVEEPTEIKLSNGYLDAPTPEGLDPAPVP